MTTPRLALTQLVSGQALPETNVNEAVRWLEHGNCFAVLSRTTTAEPGSPADGDTYILPGSPTGTHWSGQGGKIAQYVNTAWEFKTAKKGMVAYVIDTDSFVGYSNASAWVTLCTGAITVDNDTTLAGNSSTNVPSQHAVKTYVDAAVTGLLDLKGTTDCSGNPNYPAALKGDYYVVTVAGKIGGASGTTVAIGDVYFAVADNAGGTQAGAGSSWDILVHASVAAGGGLLAANNLSDVANAGTSRSNLGLGTSATVNTGTSGATIPLLNGANTHSGLSTFSAGIDLTPAATPSTTAAGYLGTPINTQNGTYTTLMTDAGKALYHTSGSAHTWTIDSNANVAYPIGTILTFINENAGGVVTLAITSDTLRWTTLTGSRSLAANGTATAIKVASTTWRLTGDGIT